MPNKITVPTETKNQAAAFEETLGVFLRTARLNQGLELSTIAAETKIAIQNLIALEEDNRPALPADVFVRGFVKLYAAHLGLDPQEAIRRFEGQWGPGHYLPAADPLAPPRPDPASAWMWVGVVILLGIALVLGIRYYLLGNQP